MNKTTTRYYNTFQALAFASKPQRNGLCGSDFIGGICVPLFGYIKELFTKIGRTHLRIDI